MTLDGPNESYTAHDSTHDPIPNRSVRYMKGQWVYSQGSLARTLFRIETGLLRLVKVTLKGRMLTVRHLLPGDYFGEEALEECQHQYGVEALTRALVIPLEPATLEVAQAVLILRNLSEQMSRAMQYGYHLQTGELKQRVVRYLLELADTPLGGEDGQNLLFVKVTHELIAEGTFSTRESVSKIITELREASFIESGYRQITLKNIDGLHQILAQPKLVELQGSQGLQGVI